MGKNKKVSSDEVLARFNALKNSRPVTTSGAINLSKLEKDNSTQFKNAKKYFKRKPYYCCAKKKEEVVED